MNTIENRKGVAAMGLFIAIPAIILIVGVIWKISTNNNDRENKELIDNATTTESIVEDDLATSTKNRDSQTVKPISTSSCNSKNQVERLNCLFETAVKTKNSTLCSQLSNPSRDICLQQVGMNAVSESVCSRITKVDLRDMCYRYVGIQKADTSICKKIVTREETDECYLRIAQITNDAKLCINVQTMERKNECLKIDPANRKALTQ